MAIMQYNAREGRMKRRDKTKHIIEVVKLIVIIIATNINLVQCDKTDDKIVENNIAKRLKVVEAVAGRAFGEDLYLNGTFRTGNSLWDNILNKCTINPSVNCLQKNVYTYLDDSLNFNGDVNVFNGVCFKKNNVDINKYSKEANIIYLTGSKDEGRSMDEENEINDEDESDSPLEEVTDALYDKSIKFMTTHDMKLTLPQTLFNGATLRISPRALTKTGALVHIDLQPREEQGRIFFKRIKKQIKKKLVFAAIAILLVIKLIALKLIFVLPLILGVTAAKKIFIKMLLFLFPPLSYLFKMCSWYYQSYHTTKYHHHHHLITHNHNKGPHAGYHHQNPTIVVRPHADGPPPTAAYEHYPQDWELSGPGLGNEYIAAGIHRNAIANFKPDVDDVNEINSWGLGLPPGPSMNVGDYSSSNNMASTLLQPQPQPQPHRYKAAGNAGRPVGPPNPYLRTKKTVPKDPLQAEKDALIRAASLAARAPPSAVRDEIIRVSAVKLTEANRIKTETELVKQQQQLLAAQDPETIAAEKFYGLLLDKVNQILVPMGAVEIGCRERAVCSLYHDPFKHAPYSNLVSNELSKDSAELLPPADSKKALQYYIYVQAARDGQEQKDCISLYPNCNDDFDTKY